MRISFVFRTHRATSSAMFAGSSDFARIGESLARPLQCSDRDSFRLTDSFQPCHRGNKHATLAAPVEDTCDMTEHAPLSAIEVPRALAAAFHLRWSLFLFARMSQGIAVSRRICVAWCALLFLAIGIGRAGAECVCQCVDGHMQPLCQSSIDLPPICPAAVCPIAAPSIAPLNPPAIPPLGTSQCRQARVCDTFGNCQWQQVCR